MNKGDSEVYIDYLATNRYFGVSRAKTGPRIQSARNLHAKIPSDEAIRHTRPLSMIKNTLPARINEPAHPVPCILALVNTSDSILITGFQVDLRRQERYAIFE